MGQTKTKIIETAIEPEKAKKLEEQKTAISTEAVEKAPSAGEKPKIKPPKKRSKRYKELLKEVDRSKEYEVAEAIKLLKKAADTKFDSTIEAHINLNTQADKPEHQMRILASLTHPVAKKAKLLVFTGKNTAEVKKLGAEVGTESTLKAIESGKIDADKIIADSSWMPKLAKVAKVLGPKGLMPNPKSGTVTDDPVKSVKDFSGGKVEVRTEKNPIIHVVIGKSSFTEKQLQENFEALLKAINEARPEGLKKDLIKNIYLSTTMSPSVKVSSELKTS